MTEIYKIILPFDTDNKEFTRGVEIGLAWSSLMICENSIDIMMHITNCEMALRMGESLNMHVNMVEDFDDFMLVRFKKENND